MKNKPKLKVPKSDKQNHNIKKIKPVRLKTLQTDSTPFNNVLTQCKKSNIVSQTSKNLINNSLKHYFKDEKNKHYNEVKKEKINRQIVLQKECIKLPSLYKNQNPQIKSFSMKKLPTQYTKIDIFEDSFKQRCSIKQSILQLMQSHQQISIDQQIDKLQEITKRYTHLRKNLVSIQEDMLTMNLKKNLGKTKTMKINHESVFQFR